MLLAGASHMEDSADGCNASMALTYLHFGTAAEEASPQARAFKMHINEWFDGQQPSIF